MAPGRKSFRSALFAFAVAGLSAAPLLMTAGCSSNGDGDDRIEWRDERRDRDYESRKERRERRKLERVLEQQKQ
jgi:hypothetical protein